MKKGVQLIYSEVAGTYELVNHVLTFGFDIQWRNRVAQNAAKIKGRKILDVCCGTGEMALSLSKTAVENAEIYLVDFSFPMLDKARQRKYKSYTSFILADANELPYKDSTFDLITISFALRNLNTRKDILLAHLEEFYRILKPGGTFINVETSQPSAPILRKVFHFYIKTFVQPVGTIISGSQSGYRYLAYTIPRFYSANELSFILRSVGFSRVDHTNKLGGIAAVHEAVK